MAEAQFARGEGIRLTPEVFEEIKRAKARQCRQLGIIRVVMSIPRLALCPGTVLLFYHYENETWSCLEMYNLISSWQGVKR